MIFSKEARRQSESLAKRDRHPVRTREVLAEKVELGEALLGLFRQRPRNDNPYNAVREAHGVLPFAGGSILYEEEAVGGKLFKGIVSRADHKGFVPVRDTARW